MLASTARYEGAYTLAMRLYSRLIGLAASLGHRRAAALVQGRQHTEQYLRQAGNTQGYVWFHASSAGELEQALPLMQAWRAQRPEDPILLSLYSPSAYRVGYCPPEADLCLMMSADLPEHVHLWIKVLRPQLAIFIKYDYWYHHFRCLHQHHIPLYIACAKLPSQSMWLRPFARPLWSAMASSVSEFWVQDQSTLDLLTASGVPQAVICGDTRYDRVLKVAELPLDDRILHAFAQNSPNPVMIGGSTWPEDHRYLLNGLVEQHLQISPKFPQGRWKLMLVPHEINPPQIQALNRLLQEISASMSTPLRWQCYSQINPHSTSLQVDLASLDVFIVDQ
ncbi:MAG: 3-deoxy-D-manno-octulosonic acid transferase, partial [Bacteroidota bacterium]